MDELKTVTLSIEEWKKILKCIGFAYNVRSMTNRFEENMFNEIEYTQRDNELFNLTEDIVNQIDPDNTIHVSEYLD